MTTSGRTFGVLVHDSPFNRALCGALLNACGRHDVPLSLLIVLRPRRSIRRGVVRRIAGAKKGVDSPLNLDGYTHLVGENVVHGQQEQFRRFETEQSERVVVVHDLGDASDLARIRERAPSLLFSEGGGLLRQPFLDLFPMGVMNMHGSGPLPAYRGLGSLEFALLDRQPVTMNVHLIDSGIDTGPVLAQRPLALTGREDLATIYAMLMRDSRDVVAETARAYLDETITPVAQDLAAGRQYFEPHPVIAAYAERRFRAKRVY